MFLSRMFVPRRKLLSYSKSAALSALVLTGPAIAGSPLTSLDAVTKALEHGVPVAVTVDLRKCTPAPGTTQPATSVGGLKIGSYRIVPDGTLSFADDHFTIDRDGSPVEQYLRYRVTPDQQIAFTMDVFSLPSYSKKIPEIGYNCRLGKDISFFAQTDY